MKSLNILLIILLLFSLTFDNYTLEAVFLLIPSITILVLGRGKISIFIPILNLIITWIGTTKGMEGDYLYYYQEYFEASYTSYQNYISDNIKSPFFYSLFYFLNLLELSFRQAIGLLIFFGNILFFKVSQNIFGININASLCNIFFLIYFPIFDSSTHLFRQHLATIIVMWAISKINLLGIVTAIFTHLTSVLFLPQIFVSFKFRKLKWIIIIIGLSAILFQEQIIEFIKIFIIDRFVNVIELEEINILTYFIITLSILALINSNYRKLFLIPSICILFTFYAFRDNSEIALRITKYFNYFIPIVLVSLSLTLSKYFKQKNKLYIFYNTLTFLVLSSYFFFKVLFSPNWTYFN